MKGCEKILCECPFKAYGYYAKFMPDRIRLYMHFMQRIWRRQKLVLTLGDEKSQFLILLLLVQKHLMTMFMCFSTL